MLILALAERVKVAEHSFDSFEIVMKLLMGALCLKGNMQL